MSDESEHFESEFCYPGELFEKELLQSPAHDHSERKERNSTLQYVVLGSRVKVIIWNILPTSTRNELKFSLKLTFIFLGIIVK